MKVDIYSDIACPWCYIGKARFDRALEMFEGEDDVEVAFRPFQLDPGAPKTALPMYDYLSAKFGGNARAMAGRVIEQARSEGLPMDYDIGLSVNTLLAHRLLRFVEEQQGAAVQRRVADRLFRAHFAEGRDVGDVDVLAEIAAAESVNRAAVVEYLRSGQGERDVLDAIAESRQMGIAAVPTFIFNEKYAVEGGQPADVFLQALQEIARMGRQGDSGHDIQAG